MSCPSICPSGGRFVPKCVPPGADLSLRVSLRDFREGRVPRRSPVSLPRPSWALSVPRAVPPYASRSSLGVSPNFERVPRRVPTRNLERDGSLLIPRHCVAFAGLSLRLCSRKAGARREVPLPQCNLREGEEDLQAVSTRYRCIVTVLRIGGTQCVPFENGVLEGEFSCRTEVSSCHRSQARGQTSFARLPGKKGLGVSLTGRKSTRANLIA